MKQVMSLILVVCFGGATQACGSSDATTPPGGSTNTNAILLPSDPTGFVKVDAVGIQGPWYSYGDGIDAAGTTAAADCIATGHHAAAECSRIDMPGFGVFTNTDSKMCTSGHVEQVLNIVGMAMPDYDNMWGAGIGFDLNNAGGTAAKAPYNATAQAVTGISFDIDAVPLTGLRIEFPTPTTVKTAAIWSAQDSKNFTSPVMKGHNEILWKDVHQPTYVVGGAALDVTQINSVQFHVPTTTSAAADYTFCISNFAALK